jgi:hypothetical protein
MTEQWEKDLFGKAVNMSKRAVKARASAQKTKNKKEAAYDNAFTQYAQNYAKANNIQYSDNLRSALKTYHQNQADTKPIFESLSKSTQKRQVAEHNAENKLLGNPNKKYMVDEYHQMNNKLGWQDDSPVTEKKFNSLKTTFDNLQAYKNKNKHMNEPTSTKKEVGSSFSKEHPLLSKTWDGIKTVGNELDRASHRINSAFTFGVGKYVDQHNEKGLEKLFKKEGHDYKAKDYYSDRHGAGKVTDTVSDSIGYLGEGGMIQKGLKGTRLAANVVKDASKLKNLAQIAKEGASIGAITSAVETPMKKINEKESTTDTIKRAALEIGLGGTGDVAAHGLGHLLSKLKKPAQQEIKAVNELHVPKKVNNVPKPNYENQKQEIELIRQAGKEQFAKNNADVINAIQSQRNSEAQKLAQQETEWSGHQEMANQYDKIMKSVGGRLNIPESNHSDFATQLGKHMYSAKGKGTGDDIYRVAEDLGFHNPDELIQHLNNGYESKQIVKSGKNKFVTQKLSGDPNNVLDELYSQTKEHQDLDKAIKEIESNQKATNEPKAMNIEPSGLDPTTAPLAEKVIPVNDHIPYKPGDPLPDTSGHIQSKTNQPLNEKIPTKDSIIQQAVDNIHTFKHADKAAKDVNDGVLHADQSMYKVALNTRGQDQIAQTNILENLVNQKGEVVGDALNKSLEGVSEDKHKQFFDYLNLKHSITRMNRGEKVFPDHWEMNAAKAEAKVKEYESLHPEFKNASEEFYKYNRQLEKTWAVDTGLMSEEAYQSMGEANPHYISNQRILPKSEKGLKMFKGNKNKFANQNADVKKGVGSELPVVNPYESAIERTGKLVQAGKQNEVMQVLGKHMEENPTEFEGIGRLVPESELTGPRKTEFQQLDGAHIDDLSDHFTNQFDRTSKKSDDNLFYFMKDGKRYYMELHNPDFINAVANLQPHTRDIATRTVGKVTNLFKLFVTGNPVFALTKNIWKDTPQAFANSYTTNNPLTFGKDLFTSFFDILTNNKHYREYKSIGGGHASSISADRNLLRQSTDKVLGRKSLLSKLRAPKDWIENFNNAVESAPRLSEYKRVMKEYDKLQVDPNAKTKLLKLGVSKYGAQQEGLFQANDITVNFKKHGNVAKTVDAYIPYLNASIQGLDKMARTFARNPIKQAGVIAAKATAAISLPTILLYSINHDDPNYQELSDYTKDNYMCIPKGDGKFYKIPVPRELGPFFKAGVERSMRQFKDNDPEAWKHYSETIKNAFLPPSKTVFQPINDVRANKNYLDAPIVPGSLEQKSPRFQYDSTSSEPAKYLGNKLNYSPKKIDYLINTYGGAIAKLVQPMTTKATTYEDWADNTFVADPVYSNDYQRDFYDLKTKIDQQYADYKGGDRKAPPDEGLRQYLNAKNKDMSEQRKAMRAILNNPNISRAKKKKDTRDLQEFINQLANLKNRK